MDYKIFDTEIEFLKGVGPLRADALKKELQIFTFFDLLYYFPFRYDDRSQFHTIRQINNEQQYYQLQGMITHVEIIGTGHRARMSANFNDGKNNLELVWFKGIRWIKDVVKKGNSYVVFGKPTLYNGEWNMAHPEIELLSSFMANKQAGLYPVYSSSEKLKLKGLDSKGIAKITKALLVKIGEQLEEYLPDYIMNGLKLMILPEALQKIHFPKNFQELDLAKKRLKFDELFFIQMQMQQARLKRKDNGKTYVFSKVGEYLNRFYNDCLPFQLTNAQKRVIKEIREDVGSGKQMNRLLQGDVGSGKTMVALMAMLIALDNGYQSCLMAPTEILANQHFVTITALLKDLPITVQLLTGSTKAAVRKEIFTNLFSGKLHILIGTHALIEDKVVFKNLGFVVIDEQHKFGVEQRAKLWQKSTLPPHILVMTATPIPRTLAMTLYGDLDNSVLDEMPPGRKPVKTIHATEAQRLRVFGFMKEQIKQGQQIYVVYPLINEAENLDLKYLMDGYESIVREFPLPHYAVSIVHGQMKPKDKDYEMQRFVRGETQIMVATVVIEVGVNVPNASVMVIENAERFGLSQLHQLRGRVGRGAIQSFCVLMTKDKLNDIAQERIQTLVRTNDGFEIAEADLRLRGPGDLQGTQQSGIVNLKIADLVEDEALVILTRKLAQQVLQEDAMLQLNKNLNMTKYFTYLAKHQNNWGMIS